MTKFLNIFIKSLWSLGVAGSVSAFGVLGGGKVVLAIDGVEVSIELGLVEIIMDELNVESTVVDSVL